jgi:hypothetical protein
MSLEQDWTTAESWVCYRMTATKGEKVASMQCYAHSEAHARLRAHVWLERHKGAAISIEALTEGQHARE